MDYLIGLSVVIINLEGMFYVKGFGYVDWVQQEMVMLKILFYIVFCIKVYNGLFVFIFVVEG